MDTRGVDENAEIYFEKNWIVNDTPVSIRMARGLGFLFL